MNDIFLCYYYWIALNGKVIFRYTLEEAVQKNNDDGYYSSQK